jgi:hypothetical protein
MASFRSRYLQVCYRSPKTCNIQHERETVSPPLLREIISYDWNRIARSCIHRMNIFHRAGEREGGCRHGPRRHWQICIRMTGHRLLPSHTGHRLVFLPWLCPHESFSQIHLAADGREFMDNLCYAYQKYRLRAVRTMKKTEIMGIFALLLLIAVVMTAACMQVAEPDNSNGVITYKFYGGFSRTLFPIEPQFVPAKA